MSTFFAHLGHALPTLYHSVDSRYFTFRIPQENSLLIVKGLVCEARGTADAWHEGFAFPSTRYRCFLDSYAVLSEIETSSLSALPLLSKR